MNQNETKNSERCEFLRSCGCALAGLAITGIAPVISGCEFSYVSSPPDGGGGGTGRTVEIDVSGMTIDGAAFKTDKVGPDARAIAIVRINATTYRAFSTQCSHSTFSVAPLGPNGVDGFQCVGGQGHGSTFNLEGIPQTGPALTTGPLREYTSEFDPSRTVLIVRVG